MIDRDLVISSATAGATRQQIATRCGCSERDVDEVLNTFAAERLRPSSRAVGIALSGSRIERLINRFMHQAIEHGDAAAGTLVCKLEQRLSALYGWDQPQKMDMSVAVEPYVGNSTQQLQRVLWELRHPGEVYTPPEPEN